MGTKITGTYGQSKHQFTKATQAAGVLAISAGQCGIFIGSNIYKRHAEVENALELCINRLREKFDPVATNNTYARKDLNEPVVYGASASIAGVSEDDVVAMYDDTFFPHAGSSGILEAFFERLKERWLEESKNL